MISTLIWRSIVLVCAVLIAVLHAILAGVCLMENWQGLFLVNLIGAVAMGFVVHRGWNRVWFAWCLYQHEKKSILLDEYANWIREAKQAYYEGDDSALFVALGKCDEVEKKIQP